MNALLIFDHLNDLIYTKYNKEFVNHIRKFATLQGLISENEVNNETIENNVLIQMFSPIITSQRIMTCQFGNSYTSIQCEDDINMCFDEYMGFLFICIDAEKVFTLKKFLNICTCFVRYLCGPDVNQLKISEDISNLYTNLLTTWIQLQNNDQAIFIEAIEQLMVNTDLSSTLIQILRKSVEKLSSITNCSKIHAIIFVQSKILSLYSSENARYLCPSDILLMAILSESCSFKNEMKSFQLLLGGGSSHNHKCLPHVIHIIQINEGIHLIYLLEIGNALLSSSLYDVFYHLHMMQLIQIQRETETLKNGFDNFDKSIKKLHENLKKLKNLQIQTITRQMIQKWDFIRKKYLEYIKNNNDEALLRAENMCLDFLEILKDLLKSTSIDKNVLDQTYGPTHEIGKYVSEKLSSYNEFLKVKATINFSLGSRNSLTINKYLEEFPGLVHFLYVDRTTHKVITPTIDFSSPETVELTKKKIWYMVNFSRVHLQEGNLSLMWKDTTFNYSYFLWFEDSGGSPMKPLIYPTNSTKNLPLPGLFGEDFYEKLKEVCFPKTSPDKIKCFELFCIHLGLVTASCVLEHTRRLAATIWEFRGLPSHPIDLL